MHLHDRHSQTDSSVAEGLRQHPEYLKTQTEERKECLVFEVYMKEPGFHFHSLWVISSKLFDLAVALFSQLSNEASTFKDHGF